MSDSLSTLIAKVQNLLGDASGTYFTTAIITAAAREALKTFNIYVPVNAAVLIAGVTDQYNYELSDSDPKAINVLDVLLQGDTAEVDTSITFDDYNEDERIFFRLRTPVTSADMLIARYNIPHTINGLDNETESTIPAPEDPILITGIAAEALRVRARSRTETINLSKDQSDNYLEQAKEMKTEFRADLKELALHKRPAVSEPDSRAWNDKYHWVQQ